VIPIQAAAAGILNKTLLAGLGASAAVDPANPQSWNRYAYVRNNPLGLIDPSGLFPFFAAGCLFNEVNFYVNGEYDSTEIFLVFCGSDYGFGGGGHGNSGGGNGTPPKTKPPTKPPNNGRSCSAGNPETDGPFLYSLGEREVE
jgi:hypothetical protein